MACNLLHAGLSSFPFFIHFAFIAFLRPPVQDEREQTRTLPILTAMFFLPFTSVSLQLSTVVGLCDAFKQIEATLLAEAVTTNRSRFSTFLPHATHLKTLPLSLLFSNAAFPFPSSLASFVLRPEGPGVSQPKRDKQDAF